MIKKTWKHTKHGAHAGFKRTDRAPRKAVRTLNALLLTIPPKGNGFASIQLVAENNYMRRFLYWINAPRWMTRAV